ncbi:MAG: hypothetical protein AAF388_05460 [Bacteroidota bacterium]
MPHPPTKGVVTGLSSPDHSARTKVVPLTPSQAKDVPPAALRPLEYNGPQLGIENPKTLTVDKLWINLVLDIETFRSFEKKKQPYFQLNRMYEGGEVFQFHPDSDVILEHKGFGNQQYKHMFRVVYDGEVWGTLKAGTRCVNDKTTKNLATLELENHLFYAEGWTEELQDVIKQLAAQYHNTSKLDIAHDSPDNQRILDFIDKWHFARGAGFECLGRQKKSKPKFQLYFNDGGEQRVTSFDWGSRRSAKWLTVYDKTSYMEEHCPKEYIGAMFERNGMEGTVIRAELKLSRDKIEQIKGFDIFSLEDVNYLASIYSDQITNWFEFVPDTGNKQRNRRKRVQLLDLKGFHVIRLERSEATPADNLYTAKLMVKSLYEKVYYQGKQSYKPAFQGLLQEYGLELWFKNKIDFLDQKLTKKYRRLKHSNHYQQTGT